MQGACYTEPGRVLRWEAGPGTGKTSGFDTGAEKGGVGAKLPMEAGLAQEAPGGDQLQTAVTQQPEEQKVGLLSHLHPSAPWRGQKA